MYVYIRSIYVCVCMYLFHSITQVDTSEKSQLKHVDTTVVVKFFAGRSCYQAEEMPQLVILLAAQA